MITDDITGKVNEIGELIENFYEGEFGKRAKSAFLKEPKKYAASIYLDNNEVTGLIVYRTNSQRKTNIKLLAGDMKEMHLLLEELAVFNEKGRFVIKVPKDLTAYIRTLKSLEFEKTGESIDGLLVKLER